MARTVAAMVMAVVAVAVMVVTIWGAMENGEVMALVVVMAAVVMVVRVVVAVFSNQCLHFGHRPYKSQTRMANPLNKWRV
jgi:amino acid transporter